MVILNRTVSPTVALTSSNQPLDSFLFLTFLITSITSSSGISASSGTSTVALASPDSMPIV